MRGTSAFNLGDLEPRKGIKKSSSSQPTSRRPSIELASNIANRSFPQLTPTHPAPSTLAGAWIVEITFRSANPALRLSRLSYLKRGSEEAQAAHFESVSAILPAASIVASSVMGMGDMGLSVQGIFKPRRKALPPSCRRVLSLPSQSRLVSFRLSTSLLLSTTSIGFPLAHRMARSLFLMVIWKLGMDMPSNISLRKTSNYVPGTVLFITKLLPVI